MKKITFVSAALVREAHERIHAFVKETPLQYSERLSQMYGARVYLKREDMQSVRSYKIRGAYNRMSLLLPSEKKRGVVCASAGNHAQGVALSCSVLAVHGDVFMPRNTPRQKIERVRAFGKKYIQVHLVGDTFDDASREAQQFCIERNAVFIHPFNDPHVSAGQGTVAVELLAQSNEKIDVLIAPVGGGGLIAGVSAYLADASPTTSVFGVEPQGAASMTEAILQDAVVTLEKLDTFVDGAAVRTVGDTTFPVAKKYVSQMVTVAEGHVCAEMIDLYQNEGIIVEPAGALSVAALSLLGSRILGKTVVCVVSGGNNDISRYPEIVERSLRFKGLKHYFIIQFAQRPGALKEFLCTALGPHDDITRFEYLKKNNRENGPALVGIELRHKDELASLESRMQALGLVVERLSPQNPISQFLL